MSTAESVSAAATSTDAATATAPAADAPTTATQPQSSNATTAATSTDATATSVVTDEDAEIEAMRQRVAEMEEEAKRMSELSGAGTTAAPAGSPGQKPVPGAPSEAQQEVDQRSIHVSQVDYSVTEEELKQLFEACGSVNRATILKDKFTGQPKGFAYIEFADAEAVANAMILNETEFKGRTLKIQPKRTNIPGLTRGRGRGGSRGRGGRGGYGGGYAYGGYDPSGYGPIRGRGRGRGRYHPYHQY